MLKILDLPGAELYQQGAHLTRFKDWLYLSSRSHFEVGKAIRGGIPVVFPWFGPKHDDSSAPQHGWARTSRWEVESQSENTVALTVSHDEWHLRLAYEFGDSLSARVEVQNLDSQTRSFEMALHTYFAVSNIASVEIEGLDGLTYLDKPSGNARLVQSGDVRFAGEVDRIYLDAPSLLHILDGERGYELRGDWRSAVTWNPGPAKAAQMSDLGENEWPHFVCLEVGAIADNAVELESQETWTMSAEFSRL